MLAIFAVFVAPGLGRRFGDVRALGFALAAITAILVVMGVFETSQTALIVCVVASGSFLGITNTLMTQVVMESAPVARPIASSAYSFVRFCGGAIAPFAAGKLAEHVGAPAPFYLGAAMTAIGVGTLYFYRRSLVAVQPPETAAWRAAAGADDAGSAPAGLPSRPAPRAAPLVVAVGGAGARRIAALSVPLARARGGEVYILHVLESDIVAGEETVALESEAAAAELIRACLAELHEAGVPIHREVLRSIGDHAAVAGRILERAAELGAGAIVVGPESAGPLGGRVAALAGWPATVERAAPGGWVLRATPGLDRSRCNHALPPARELAAAELEPGIERVRAFAAEHGTAAGIQVSPLHCHARLMAALDERGWGRRWPTLVLTGPLPGSPGTAGSAAAASSAGPPGAELVVTDVADAAWLRAWARCEPGRDVAAHARTVFAALRGRAAFARLGQRAVGIAVPHGEWLGMFCLAVDPERRREGLGTALVTALTGPPLRAGTTRAYLQVEASNMAARGLYARLGFGEAYRYCHRVAR
jgi:ribosomal protein S18 acetylase RimI-like enzyme/nucleotide-binding universal stress UspA family protein